MPKRGTKPFNGYVPTGAAAAAPRGQARACDWPGCDGDGEYPAPKSRNQIDERNWFCLDHIRLVNAAWNYCEGMSEDEIEAEIRRDAIGRRPTWPLGARAAAMRFAAGRFGDSFGLFEDEAGGAADDDARRQWRPGSPEDEALVVLDLKPPVTADAVKARYKQLVKRHHPDANGGDKVSEEKFKQINQAYHTIMQSLAP